MNLLEEYISRLLEKPSPALLQEESASIPQLLEEGPDFWKEMAPDSLAASFLYGLFLINRAGKIPEKDEAAHLVSSSRVKVGLYEAASDADKDEGLFLVFWTAKLGLREAIMYMATYYLNQSGLLTSPPPLFSPESFPPPPPPPPRKTALSNASFFLRQLSEEEKSVVFKSFIPPKASLRPALPPRFSRQGKSLVRPSW